MVTVSKIPPHCHAVLLASLLLGLHLNAYIALGSTTSAEAAAWVTTISANEVAEFWDPTAGARWMATDVNAHPYRRLGCLFNHQNFYANISPSDSVSGLEFDLEAEWMWKPIPVGALTLAKKFE
ncbi:Centrosomal protein of 76 kDa [Phlyctochytrium bullatum]|nr:Centrosomal protein of 76 kDa [Phlyctochytrium bullatum]